MSGPCRICIEKSEEIRDILKPFGLDTVEPVGGVRLLAEMYTRAQRRITELGTAAAIHVDAPDTRLPRLPYHAPVFTSMGKISDMVRAEPTPTPTKDGGLFNDGTGTS